MPRTATSPATASRPRWRTVTAGPSGSERYLLMEAGDPDADPLVFLHGWGLTPRTYAEGVCRLVGAGVRVVAPALPGAGSTGPGLREVSMEQYAARVARALEAAGVDRPAFVVGHSFGGGVAVRLATDRPDLVRSLTLVNSVGGAPGPRAAHGGARAATVGGGLTRRSWLRWAAGALGELHPVDALAVAPAVVRDALPVLARNPLTATLSALLALRCSLADEASALIDAGLPVLFVWSDSDRLVAPGALSEVSGALPAQVVQGRHGWLLTRPEEFAALLRNALVVHAMLERRRRGQAVVLPEGFALGDLLPPERRRAGSGTGGRPRTGGRPPARRRTDPAAPTSAADGS